jgi:PsbP
MDDPIMISNNSRVEDASATSGTVAYLLHYFSVGKRGNKHLWNKIIIQNQLLYVLTAQCKEGDYEGLAKEMKQTVASFQVG